MGDKMWKVTGEGNNRIVELDRDYAYRKIREVVTSYDWTRSTADAYMGLILDSILNRKGGRVDSPESAIPFIKQANLPMDADLEKALSGAWSQSRYLRCGAYDSVVLDEVHQGGYVNPSDSKLLLGIVESLGKQQSWALKPQIAKKEQAVSQRRHWIATIANGKSTYPVWRKEHGQFRYPSVDDLQNESDEMLEALAQRVPEWRAQLAGRTAPKPSSSSVAEEGGIVSAVKPQTRLVETADEFLANPEHPEREYTATEIRRMSRPQINNLLFINGQSRGLARRNAVDRVLRSEPYQGE